MFSIHFQNKDFKVRELDLPEFGSVLISTTSLSNLIVDENGNYLSDEAIAIDEQLFFFVEENEIDLDENELITIINSAIV
ncbi:MAG: hypothetical protein SFY56_14325 [Bacteroidota bacterium]|nr:hypothetical protein [Bacteroidota bacterium]